MKFESLDELLNDLYDYGTQTVYGVTCENPGFADMWGFTDASFGDAQARARELTARHGVQFHAVSMRLTPRVSRRNLGG